MEIQLQRKDKMKWISVEDKFPKGGQCVLLFSKESGVAEGAYSEIEFWQRRHRDDES